MKNHSKLLTGLVMGALLTGCASQGAQQEKPVDPWEGFNRKVFVFNDTIDRYALKPVAQGYDKITPQPIQTGVGNFFSNLGELRTVLNSVLQWKWGNAGVASGRFLVNTTLGLGGVLDPASRMEWMARTEDFGQTLGTWGVAEGPYVVLPILGSSTVRDTTALPVDWYSYPVTYIDNDPTRYGLRFLQAVDLRASLLEQEKLIRGDRYIFLRDAYLQRRRFEVNDGKSGADPFASDDFDFDDSDFDDSDFAD
ncbi:VacJ family lipoprotein [Halomonas sp. PR-M31]|uniref:MlaA family lipoprotein n=1 Tax=Halomonas sp. PR-M31 TaxID=1471202 RepID=UPI000650B71E|nr:VacJ family lipoprotein [Halomonas sp. PR-M31]